MRVGELGGLIWDERIAGDLLSSRVYDIEVQGEFIYVTGREEAFLALLSKRKTDDGSLIWSKRVSQVLNPDLFSGPRPQEELLGVIPTLDGGAVVGYSSITFESNDFILAKLDGEGNKVWSRKRDGEKFNLVAQRQDGTDGYLFTGTRNGKLALVKFGLNGELFPFCGSEAAAAAPTDCPEEIEGFTLLGEFGNSKYFLSDASYRPMDAKTTAENFGGYLAVISSKEENDFIASELTDIAYIGLNDEANEGQEVWSNGEVSTYRNLDENPLSQNAPNGDYVVMNFWDGSWSWKNSLWTTRKYILEVDCGSSLREAQEINRLDEIKTATTPYLDQVFPNPATDEVQLNILSAQDYTIEIFLMNSTGSVLESRKVALTTGENSMRFDLSNLPSGVYHLFSPDAHAKRAQQRFVKVRD